MSEHVGLPRVVIRKSKGEATLQINFGIVEPELETESEDDDKIVDRLISLADDWTSFCISGMRFTPTMAQAGYFWLEHAVDEQVITFLNDVSISKETNIEADDAIVYSYILHEDDLQEVAKKLATTTQMIRAADAVKRSTLGSLIAEFDYFTLRFLEICAEKLPEKFYDESKTFSLKEIKRYPNLDDLIRSLVAETIGKKLRESHSDTVGWIIATLGLSQDVAKHRENHIFREFIEVCQRRHVLTHNGGIINETYVEKCREAGLELSKLPKIGERAEISQQYLRRATARVYLTGYYLVHLFIQNIITQHKQRSYSNLLSTSHAFLEQDLTKMALRVVDFAEISSKKFDHELRLKFGINRALCALLDPSQEAGSQLANAEVQLCKYDWSVKDPIFSLALACVRREYDSLIDLARAAYGAGLDYSSARTFVVFREARDISGFLECFPRALLRLKAPDE